MSSAVIINKKVQLDDLLVKFSFRGRYYVCFMVMISLLMMINNIECNNYIFVAEYAHYWCADVRFGNNSCASLSNSTDVCTEWVYEDPHSFVAEFQLACQEWKRTLVGTVHNFGYGAGLLIVGPLSDRWGRKPLIVITSAIGTVVAVVRSFTTNYWCFIVLEFFEAAFGDAYSPAYILLMEIVTHEKRVLGETLCSIGFCFGGILLPLVAWLVPYWRNLIRVLYGPTALFLLYIFLMDESPRWLLSKGQKVKAIAVLEKMAKNSRVKLDKELLENLSYEESERVEFKEVLRDTFTSRVLLKRFFICLIWWITSTFITYGMNINSVSLPGSKYLNFGLSKSMDYPAYLLTWYTLIRFRRKYPLMCSFLLAAVVCFVQPFFSNNIQWLSIVFYLFGKVLAKSCFSSTYIFTTELFPTLTRNSMHALCSSLGRIGSTIAPQTPLLMAYWHGLPSLTFGAASLGAGLVTTLAPDTANDTLPDNVRQAEAIGHKNDSNDIENYSDHRLQPYTIELKANNELHIDG